MNLIILLDSGPLGLATNPKASPQNDLCSHWIERMLLAQHTVLVPEITDYETRRELIRAGKIKGLAKLDTLKSVAGYLPMTTAAMVQAAHFWAQARQSGMKTASDVALDADMVLAQASTLNPAVLGKPQSQVVVATMNVGHLSRFVSAQDWQTIS